MEENKKMPEETANGYREAMSRIGVALSFTKGVSMRPLIYQGIGYVGIVPALDIEIGDLLLFEQRRNGSNICILHRLIAIVGDVLITRGDNCLGSEKIKRADVIGKTEKIYWRRTAKYRLNPLLWLMPRLLHASIEAQDYYIKTDNPYYLKYVKIWTKTWPLRRIYYRARGLAYAVYRKLKGAL